MKAAMELNLKGKNAAVPGGTRGIGRAIAETLAGEGAHVIVDGGITTRVNY